MLLSTWATEISGRAEKHWIFKNELCISILTRSHSFEGPGEEVGGRGELQACFALPRTASHGDSLPAPISGRSSRKESLRQHPAWPSQVTGENWGQRGTVTSPRPHGQGPGQDWNSKKRKNQYDWACLYLQFWYCFPPWSFVLALIWFLLLPKKGFPGGSGSKASACNAGDLSWIPGSGRSPGEGNGNPLQYSCLENPMDRGA